MDQKQTARTIKVKGRTWRAPLRVHYPDGTHPSWRTMLTRRYPGTRQHPDYDADLAMELIANTGEIPASRYDLIVVLGEYRHALHDLATQARNNHATS